MEVFKLLTPVSYWLLIAMWTGILAFYLGKLRAKEEHNRLLITLVVILAIDAFRTLFESLYFGAWYTSLMGILPRSVYDFLIQPQFVLIPKLFNVVAAVLVIAILIRRWLPQEKEEREKRRQRLTNLEISTEEHRKTLEHIREREEMARAFFDNHHAVMLLIDPSDGRILNANPAAESFYGYGHGQLNQMSITDINTLAPDQVRQEMQRAKDKKRKYFLFRHRLASGEVRDVEVYSAPMRIGGKEQLYSVVHDITDRLAAEREHQAKVKLDGVMEMAGAACHELNQPLQILTTQLHLLTVELGEDDRFKTQLANLTESVERAGSITRKIMGITRYEILDYIEDAKIIDIDKASQ